MPENRLPLCVDLDGTLVKVDSLHEQLIRSVLTVRSIPGLIRHLLGGRASLKAFLAGQEPVDAAHLPYHPELVEWLRAERASGRRIVLITAADQAIADEVAAHLGLFDEVVGTNGGVNLKGATKAAHLVDWFGERGFAYAGDARADITVWRRSGAAIPVAASPGSRRQAAKAAPIERTFPRHGPSHLRSWSRALRPQQWIKNVLVFAPLVLSRQYWDIAGWRAAATMFLAFCAAASAVYLFNDLTDLRADRRHPTKKARPLAAGNIGAAAALAAGVGLTALGLTLGWLAGAILPLLIYLLATSAYSAGLKTRPLVDVFLLAGLYTIRLVAGGVASHHPVSRWLLAFSAFLFLALGVMKRVAELRARGADGSAANVRRGYSGDDLPFLELLGVAASVTSSLVLVMYAQAHEADLGSAGSWALWAVAPAVLFWQARLWLATFRGYMLEDPIAYATKDWVTRLIATLTGALYVASSFF